MNLNINIPPSILPEARVWIYQSNRPFFEKEIVEINEQLENFYMQWLSHGIPVTGWAACVYSQFVVVMANEDNTTIGGCSTDGMVRIIKSFERQYNVNMFDRHLINFLVKNKVQPLPMNQIIYALQNNYIETDTCLFNNLVTTKAMFETEWLIPLNKSWLWPRIIAQQETSVK
jgi:hypothetical protein